MRYLICFFSALLLSGCANHAADAVRINNALMGGGADELKRYKNNPYILQAESPFSAGDLYPNATAPAIYHRNIDAVRYLISQDAVHNVSIWHRPVEGGFRATPVNVPAAELACGLGAFDIMELLEKTYPVQKVNYTNCLHYLVGSGYVSMKYSFRHERTQAEINSGVKKLLALGGDPMVLPEYGRPMQLDVLHDLTINRSTASERLALLKILLDHGVDPNTEYPYLNAKETMLTNLAIYTDQVMASAAAKMLVQYGAQANKLVSRSVVYDASSPHAYNRQTRQVTALHMARFFDKNDYAATLIELGADLNRPDSTGRLAKSYAGSFQRIETKRRQLLALAPVETTTSEERGGSSFSVIMGILEVTGSAMGY
ncbi:ankyrin repeat domain-containing protein [Colwellia sp. E2M01]|uniref:ankyrin repeat domain-containing protein n=1 Tax=Colwellia sp. E2M01 TaxID=2841561 RepID=UPI001C09C63D|nr:ankyrin repeat domain-containing protein [Colwellia sp. E2M01]MBU2870557.1 ankyrin repeat domain-containing protein [Colwellia sp. E2M01]